MYYIIEILSKIVSRIYIPVRRRFSYEEEMFFRRNDKPGLLILSRNPWNLSNPFIKGWSKHSIVTCGMFSMVDSSVKDGTRVRHISSLCQYKEYVVYELEGDYSKETFREVALEIGLSPIGYDHRHLSGNRLYDCVETTLNIFRKSVDKFGFKIDFPMYPDKILKTAKFKEVARFKDGVKC